MRYVAKAIMQKLDIGKHERRCAEKAVTLK